jgi:hypothetical protein
MIDIEWVDVMYPPIAGTDDDASSAAEHNHEHMHELKAGDPWHRPGQCSVDVRYRSRIRVRTFAFAIGVIRVNRGAG